MYPNSVWSEWRESNSRPLEPHSSALPSCATPGNVNADYYIRLFYKTQVFFSFFPFIFHPAKQRTNIPFFIQVPFYGHFPVFSNLFPTGHFIKCSQMVFFQFVKNSAWTDKWLSAVSLSKRGNPMSTDVGWGTPRQGSLRPNNPADYLASPPELLGILRVSPIAMGEEGLRPSTPPPLKRWSKLLCFIASNLLPFLEKPGRVMFRHR